MIDFGLNEEQIRDILDKLAIKVVYCTVNEFACFCPFHDNTDSPALNVSKHSGLWKCWSGACGSHGNLLSLMTRLGYSGSEAQRMIKKGQFERTDFEKALMAIFFEDEQKSEWSHDDLYGFREQDSEWDFVALKYLEGRGISKEAYDYFMMGFSARKKMLTIPIMGEGGDALGIIGRSIEQKFYQYSSGFDRSGTLWNLNNVKKYDSVILTEGALDSVYIWQAGFPSVCAVFGSSISDKQWRLINKHFNTIYCFFDNDPAGIALTNTIIETQRTLEVLTVQYPRDVKDPGELSRDEISYMIANAKSGLHRLFAL